MSVLNGFRRSNVVPLNPFCTPLPVIENVQGTFQMCRETGKGRMTISCVEGEALVEIDEAMAAYILLHLPDRQIA